MQLKDSAAKGTPAIKFLDPEVSAASGIRSATRKRYYALALPHLAVNPLQKEKCPWRENGAPSVKVLRPASPLRDRIVG